MKKNTFQHDMDGYPCQQANDEKTSRRCYSPNGGWSCCECWLLGSLTGSIVLAIIIVLWLIPVNFTTIVNTTGIVSANITLSITTTTMTVSTSTTTTTTVSTSTTTTTTVSTSTTTTTTVSASTTTITSMVMISRNNSLFGLWKTVTSQNGTQATPGISTGNYISAEPPFNAFDSNCSTKYTSFGSCAVGASSTIACGLNTGFHVTIVFGAVTIRSLRFCTGNDNPPRDPLIMTVEGSNQSGSALFDGASWALIYNGSTGLDADPGRRSYGVLQTLSNTIGYTSYRFLMLSKRGADSAIQYSEIQLFT